MEYEKVQLKKNRNSRTIKNTGKKEREYSMIRPGFCSGKRFLDQINQSNKAINPVTADNMTNIKAKFINSISSILSKRQFNHDLTYVQMLTKRSTHPY